MCHSATSTWFSSDLLPHSPSCIPVLTVPSSQFLLFTVNCPHSSVLIFPVLRVPSLHCSMSYFPFLTVTVPCPNSSFSSQSQCVVLSSLSYQFPVLTVPSPHCHSSLSSRSQFPLLTVPCPQKFPLLTATVLFLTVSLSSLFPLLTVPFAHSHSSLSSQFPALTVSSLHSSLSSQFPLFLQKLHQA